jgi:hypothetical protein
MSESEGRERLFEMLGTAGMFDRLREHWRRNRAITRRCLFWLGKRRVHMQELTCTGEKERFARLDTTLALVCKNSPYLTRLTLCHWNLEHPDATMSPARMAEIGRLCPYLLFLRFEYCGALSQVVVEAVKHMPRLIVLQFSNTDIDDDAIIAVSEHCHDLLCLCLFGDFHKITDVSLDNLGLGCPNLETFYIGGFSLITQAFRGSKKENRMCTTLFISISIMSNNNS